jgi:proteasome lid subunit RPN8/RPN11
VPLASTNERRAKAAAYARRSGVPDKKLKAATDGISHILSLPTDETLANPYPEAPEAQPSKESEGASDPLLGGADSYAENRRRNGAIIDLAELGPALSRNQRVSSIIPELISREIPAWNIAGSIIEKPEDFALLVQTIRSPYFESLKVAFLDEHNKVTHSQILFVGTLNEVIFHPRDFIQALQSARRIGPTDRMIVSHNHPSGDPNPSRADMSAQSRLEETAAALGVTIVDHIITNCETCYSFRTFSQCGIGAYIQPWEAVPRSRLIQVDGPAEFNSVLKSLRGGAPDAAHIVYLNTKMHLTAVERIPEITTIESAKKLESALVDGIAREGAYAVMLDLCGMDQASAERTKLNLEMYCGMMGVKLLDVASRDMPSMMSVMEEPDEPKVEEEDAIRSLRRI